MQVSFKSKQVYQYTTVWLYVGKLLKKNLSCIVSVASGVVRCWGESAGHVWSQQLVGTECLSVCQWNQLLRFQEADVVCWAAGLWQSGWHGQGTHSVNASAISRNE